MKIERIQKNVNCQTHPDNSMNDYINNIATITYIALAMYWIFQREFKAHRYTDIRRLNGNSM